MGRVCMWEPRCSGSSRARPGLVKAWREICWGWPPPGSQSTRHLRFAQGPLYRKHWRQVTKVHKQKPKKPESEIRKHSEKIYFRKHPWALNGVWKPKREFLPLTMCAWKVDCQPWGICGIKRATELRIKKPFHGNIIIKAIKNEPLFAHCSVVTFQVLWGLKLREGAKWNRERVRERLHTCWVIQVNQLWHQALGQLLRQVVAVLSGHNQVKGSAELVQGQSSVFIKVWKLPLRTQETFVNLIATFTALKNTSNISPSTRYAPDLEHSSLTFLILVSVKFYKRGHKWLWFFPACFFITFHSSPHQVE